MEVISSKGLTVRDSWSIPVEGLVAIPKTNVCAFTSAARARRSSMRARAASPASKASLARLIYSLMSAPIREMELVGPAGAVAQSSDSETAAMAFRAMDALIVFIYGIPPWLHDARWGVAADQATPEFD